jgi:hypothetical protein
MNKQRELARMSTTLNARVAASSDASSSTQASQTRLNININSQTAKVLRDYAEKNGVSVTEAVRRLIGVGTIIDQAQQDGKDVVLKDGEATERLVFTY